VGVEPGDAVFAVAGDRRWGRIGDPPTAVVATTAISARGPHLPKSWIFPRLFFCQAQLAGGVSGKSRDGFFGRSGAVRNVRELLDSLTASPLSLKGR
jgi:hypothetical protein